MGVFGPLRMASENDKDGDNDFWQQQKAQKNVSKIQGDLMALVSPASDFLDNISGGWALSYADLTPNSERTLLGQIFLATNIAYTIVGLYLSLQGEVLLGTFTEICSIASFCYHYAQLQQPYGRTQDSTVRLALLLDYVLAITSILIGLFYLIFDHAVPSPEGIAIAILGILCLLSCWVWEQGKNYAAHSLNQEDCIFSRHHCKLIYGIKQILTLPIVFLLFYRTTIYYLAWSMAPLLCC
jgi:hypothetical protein